MSKLVKSVDNALNLARGIIERNEYYLKHGVNAPEVCANRINEEPEEYINYLREQTELARQVIEDLEPVQQTIADVRVGGCLS